MLSARQTHILAQVQTLSETVRYVEASQGRQQEIFISMITDQSPCLVWMRGKLWKICNIYFLQ